MRPAEPAWVEHAVLWHLHPLTFLGAPAVAEPDAAPVPRLRGLVPWLDHLLALGANGLLLGPVFASSSHGYDTVDHFRVDPRLGTETDLEHLVAEAHQRGVRVVLDGVFNHVGRDFGPLRDAEQRGPDSPYAGWFRRDGQGRLAVFEGHDILVALDHDQAAVVDHVVDVLRHWLRLGVDGWRLDAAYAVPDRFWAQVSERITAEFPDAWLLGEVIHGDYAARVRDGGLHAVTQYELWKAVWSGLNDRNLFELSYALGRHDALVEDFVPQTFVGNHDVTRIASRLTDPRHLPHALAVLFTAAGTPSVYAGDELGLQGVKEDRAGGDDAIRPAFPDAPDKSERGELFRLHQTLIGVRRRHPWLHRARTRVEHLANTTMVYRCQGPDGQQLAVGLNVGDAALDQPLSAGDWTVEAGTGAVQDGVLQLPAQGWVVLAVAGS